MAQQSGHHPRKSELGAGNTAYVHHIKDLLGKTQKPPWDERQVLKPLLPAQLHLHCITTDNSLDFMQ